MEPRFDPAKDAINQDRHGLSLAFGDRIFEANDHVVLPTIRAEDKEDRRCCTTTELRASRLGFGRLSGRT